MTKKATTAKSRILSPHQSLILATLRAANAPLSAYAILERVSGQGIKAPLQVYRALEKLRSLGMVHKLESLNAFMACTQDGKHDHDTTAFTICDDCGQVAELPDQQSPSDLLRQAKADGFEPAKTTIELHGTCGECQQ